MAQAFRIASLCGLALLTGCTGPTLQQVTRQHLEESAKRYSIPAPQAVTGNYAYGRSEEAQRIMQDIAAKAREWVHGDRSKRVTTDGPVLSAYGVEGASSYEDVIRCALDVAFVVNDSATRERFDRRCYDLLPANHRAMIYKTDSGFINRNTGTSVRAR